MKSQKSKPNWRRKDSAVTHHDRGHGVITNFVGCNNGCANVYFYEGQYVVEVARYELKRAGSDWHDHSGPEKFDTPIAVNGMLERRRYTKLVTAKPKMVCRGRVVFVEEK